MDFCASNRDIQNDKNICIENNNNDFCGCARRSSTLFASQNPMKKDKREKEKNRMKIPRFSLTTAWQKAQI